jgi:hypothetical protein
MTPVVGCGEPTAIVIEPLRIIAWSPAAYPCVDPGVTVRAVFSADLDPATLSAASFSLLDTDGVVPTTIEYDSATSTASLQPVERLAFDRSYTASATEVISSLDRGGLPAPVASSFHTISRSGCLPSPDCFHPSDCDAGQICSNLGLCVSECVTDRDCYRGRCHSGSCVPDAAGAVGDEGSGGSAG